MTWFKVDDSFYDHPKVFDLPDSAVALWVRAGCWSARNLKDGFVPTGMPARLCDDPDAAIRALIDRGLWKRTRGGFRFHDWSVYQPTREEAIAASEKKSSGGRLGNHRRWHVDRGVVDPQCDYCQEKRPSHNRSESDRTTDGPTESGANPPSRPVPSRKNDGSVVGNGDGSQSVRAGAHVREVHRYLTRRFHDGLTEPMSAQVLRECERRSPKPIRNPVKYIQGMDEGDLADIVGAVMDADEATKTPLELVAGESDQKPSSVQPPVVQLLPDTSKGGPKGVDPNDAFRDAKAQIKRKYGS